MHLLVHGASSSRPAGRLRLPRNVTGRRWSGPMVRVTRRLVEVRLPRQGWPDQGRTRGHGRRPRRLPRDAAAEVRPRRDARVATDARRRRPLRLPGLEPGVAAGDNPAPRPRVVRAYTLAELDALEAELGPAYGPLVALVAATGQSVRGGGGAPSLDRGEAVCPRRRPRGGGGALPRGTLVGHDKLRSPKLFAATRMATRVAADAPGTIRTCDLCLRRAALYPLSYGRGNRSV